MPHSPPRRKASAGGLALLLALCLLGCLPAAPIPTPVTRTPSPSPTQPHQPTPAAPTPIPPQPTRTPEPAPTDTPAGPPTPTPSPSASPLPHPAALAASPLLEVWDDPAFEGVTLNRQTQLVLGERVLVVQTRGDWAEIRALQQASSKNALGYPGWVRRAGLAPDWPAGADLWVVIAAFAPVYTRPDSSAERMLLAPLDARMAASQADAAWVNVRLPGERTGWVERTLLRPLAGGETKLVLAELLGMAHSLAGAPYLWGGTAPGAFDCSGFVYRLFASRGLTLARDAMDQARNGTPVKPDTYQPGDLLFFSPAPGGNITHVALYTGSLQVLDAQLEQGLKTRSLYELLTGRYLVAARRVLP